MYFTVNVLYCMIDYLMLELLKAVVGPQGITIARGPSFDVFANFRLNRLFLSIWDHGCANPTNVTVLTAF